MTTLDCPQITLVEAHRDGRLGPQESASLDRHLVTCATCTAFARDLARIADALRVPRQPVTPLSHQRERFALLRRAVQSPVERSARRGGFIALAAGALTIAMGVGWAGARITAPAQRPALARHIPAAPKVGMPRTTTLGASDGAVFDRSTTAGLDVVTLVSGALDVIVSRLAANERFLVRTSDAEIEVRGTSFHVDAERGRIRSITVSEGSAEVRYAGFSAVIPSGGSWRANRDTVAAPVATVSPTASVAIADAPSKRASLPVAKVAVAARPVAVEREAPQSAPTVAVEAPAPLSPSVASREFAEAMRSLGRGDYDGSSARLQAFSAAHPNDARADEADYVRAIALQRAGRTADAAAAAKHYLSTRPNGAHRAEARRIAGD